MNTDTDNEIQNALRAFIASKPHRTGWEITTPEQRGKMAAASRKLNTVLKRHGMDREAAWMKFGPTLF